MKITWRRARKHIALLFFCFHFYLAVIIFGFDIRVPDTPSSSFVSYIHLRFCLKVLEFLTITLKTSMNKNIYKSFGIQISSYLHSCPHLLEWHFEHGKWLQREITKNNYQTNEKIGNHEIIILLLLGILHMLTYHPGHGSSMQSHKSFWFSMRIPSASYIAAFPLS